jgi:ArsR family transcriptional regulator
MNQALPVMDLTVNQTRQICDPDLRPRIQLDEAETFAVIFKALGHSVRVQILDLISQGNGEVCGCDIERHFDLTQPTISHHLKVLRDAGLITSESRGVWVHHRVNAQMVDSLHDLLAMMHSAK